jgi:hypothetical protein
MMRLAQGRALSYQKPESVHRIKMNPETIHNQRRKANVDQLHSDSVDSAFWLNTAGSDDLERVGQMSHLIGSRMFD